MPACLTGSFDEPDHIFIWLYRLVVISLSYGTILLVLESLTRRPLRVK